MFWKYIVKLAGERDSAKAEKLYRILEDFEIDREEADALVADFIDMANAA